MSTAPKKACRSWRKSCPSGMVSIALCYTPSIRRTAPSSRICTPIFPGLEALDTADLMVLLHPLPRSARQPDEAHRGLCGIGPPHRRPAHRHACLRSEEQPDLRALQLEQQGLGWRIRTAGAGRDLDRPPRRARQAEHARHPGQGRGDIIPFCAAFGTAISGVRPMCTKCACRSPATAVRWCSARWWKACTRTIRPRQGSRTIPCCRSPG